jgi:hypothetical protein
MRRMDADRRNMTRHVRRVWPDLQGLIAAGEAVQEFEAHPGWICVQQVLEAEAAEIGRDLNRGTEPLSQAEYAMAHGRLGGLAGALEAVQAILQHVELRMDEQRAAVERDAESSQRSG